MIVCAMIVGPGEAERYLPHVLDRASRWADRLLIVADHVDTVTEAVLQREIKLGVNEAEGNAVDVWWSNGIAPRFTEDESYVRNALMQLCDKHLTPDDLVVVLDADEQLNDRETPVRTALERIPVNPYVCQAWSMTFYHLWSPDGRVYRTDGGWAPHRQDRIYRHQPGARIESRKLACTAIPASAQPRAETTLEVLHWGYARPADRVRKHAHYMEIDGGRFHSLRHLESIVGEPVLAPVALSV